MEKIRKTLRLSIDTCRVICSIASEFGITESQAVEQAVKNMNCSQQGSEGNGNDIEKKLARISEQNFHLLNLINSLVHNLNFDDFYDAEDESHQWLRKSQLSYKNKMLAHNRNKSINRPDTDK